MSRLVCRYNPGNGLVRFFSLIKTIVNKIVLHYNADNAHFDLLRKDVTTIVQLIMINILLMRLNRGTLHAGMYTGLTGLPQKTCWVKDILLNGNGR